MGNDGLARAANIRTKSGHTNRPITKLYPLETLDAGMCDAGGRTKDTSRSDVGPVVEGQRVVRPERWAARDALQKIQSWLA